MLRKQKNERVGNSLQGNLRVHAPLLSGMGLPAWRADPLTLSFPIFTFVNIIAIHRQKDIPTAICQTDVELAAGQFDMYAHMSSHLLRFCI